MLLNTIKAEQFKARKDHDVTKTSILTTLIGEIETKAKRQGVAVSDNDVISTIRKFIKSNEEVLDKVECDSEHWNTLKEENAILSSFLPSQLEEKELIDVIKQRVATLESISLQQMGPIMKWLKENYGGRFDGKRANEIVKSFLRGEIK